MSSDHRPDKNRILKDLNAEADAAHAKLDKNEPLTKDEVFAICACCQNSKLTLLRLYKLTSMELELTDFRVCQSCHVYEANSQHFPHIAKRRFEYLSMCGRWEKGTILSVGANQTYIAHLDCQQPGETWVIPPEEIGKKYFLLPETNA